MNLRKWMKLFVTTIVIGGMAAVVTGGIMQLADPQFQAGGWTMWALSGLLFGAIAHTGFFAYLMLNYIARSIFKRPQLWVALQGFIAVFVLIEIAYWSYGSAFPASTFWLLPASLAAGSLLVAWRKAYETTTGAWIPTLFFMIAVTVLEAVPGFRTWSLSSLIFLMAPLFVCNAFQIMRLHRILERRTAGPALEIGHKPA